MTLQSFKLASAGVLSALLLSACGGGGGSSARPTVHSDLSYPLSSGFQKRLELGATDHFKLGEEGGRRSSCIGSQDIKIDPLASTTFEGVAGHSSHQQSSVTIIRCAPGVPLGSGTQTGTTYYDSSYTPIGLHIDGTDGDYAVYDALPTPLPASAKSGDNGEIGTQTVYDSIDPLGNKGDRVGTRVLSYAINDAYSKTTVFLDMIIKTYIDTNRTTLISTERSRYLMAEDGSLTFKSLDVHNYPPSEYELAYTAD